ncbi:MAG: S9 family peptidase [Tannerella sp.]|jgi:dipeptidyl aminopeptidase/acylaminoacyl peptidase|nr:S9 family peptidase [Tannerella sp.]
MKYKRYSYRLIVALIISSSMLNAQEKPLTLQELIPGGRNYARFTPRNLQQLQWCGETCLYVRGDSLLAVMPPDTSERIVFTRRQLSAVLEAGALPELGTMPVFSTPGTQRNILSFQYKKHLIHYDIQAGAIVADYPLSQAWQHLEFCEANGCYACTEKNNVYILSPDRENKTVTAETDEGIVCGTSVHQNEFGIHKGLFWSPKGSALAFYRMDERMVTDYPIVDIEARTARAKPFKYPMAGMKSHEVTVGVYRLSDGHTVRLKTGEPKDKYLTNIAWSPDEQSIYIAELNRDQNECCLVRYNASTGEKEATLFIEKNDRYVEPLLPVLFLPNDASRFIWQSRRDGYNHLYLYDVSGRMIRQLTSGRWEVTNVHGFDTKGMNVFLSSTAPHPEKDGDEGNPLEIYTWQLNMKTGRQTCLHTKSGIHQARVSPSGLYLIDQTVSPLIPRDIDLVDIKRQRSIKTLLSAKNPFEKYEMPVLETGVILAADEKTPLNYRMALPPGLDRTKKYPVIVYVYGGPHAQMVGGGWMNGIGGWDLYMAKRGYIMFTIDGRGSANRGFAFESIIHRQLGVHEMEDQMKGIEYLKSLPFVDAERIGVHGWSYGGFMATNLILTYPDVFKVGVAGGPVIDWQRYEIMYGERYMDHPDDNSEGYKNADLREKAASLKGQLLLIHGDEDPVVVWQHSLSFIKACISAGTYPDYFVYPGHKHNVTGRDRPHLYEKITRYFDTYL